jgi:hypothetical protein
VQVERPASEGGPYGGRTNSCKKMSASAALFHFGVRFVADGAVAVGGMEAAIRIAEER